MFMDIIIGTAGHIDHGKTALVRGLTGIDADRLPEEKRRGITIDLGFAEFESGGVKIGFVDVPGHERFVKNMLAGATGIDLVMLVVAADEGVMPQTREHFDICRLLKIESGVIVLTKIDLVDADTLELSKLDVSELVKDSFLENAPTYLVSSRTGDGLDELKDGLIAAAKLVKREQEIFETRLAVDRSFSIKGFGAVVTGTLASGEIVEGDELELLPIGRKLRVRGIQTYGKAVKAAHAGQRTAVNLGGIMHDEIERGMVLTRAGALGQTQVIDAQVEVLRDSPRPLKSRQRVRVHIGTTEVLARVTILNDDQTIEPGSTDLAQLRLESPVAAAHGDRFIIRSYSPQRTIAGGRILDPAASRHRRSDFHRVTTMLRGLADAADGEGNIAEIFVQMAGEHGVELTELRSRTALRMDVLKRLVEEGKAEGKIMDAGGVLVTKDVFEALETSALGVIESFHAKHKLSRGVQRETLREQVFKRVSPAIFRAVTESLERSKKIVFDQDVVRLAEHEAELSTAEGQVHDKLKKLYENAGLEVPKLDEALQEAISGTGLDQKSARRVFQLFVNKGELVAVTGEYYFTAHALEQLITRLRDLVQTSGDAAIDVAKFKTLSGVSRKYAIPLLEYFDRTRVTRRVGDKREIL
jgi:selenocysteine-specific elongation factor